jgi:hypothetical protein
MRKNRSKKGKRKGKNINPKLKELKNALRNGDIDPLMWSIHFPGIRDTRVPRCLDCEDYKNGVCKGGYDPISCFKEQRKIEFDAEKLGGLEK